MREYPSLGLEQEAALRGGLYDSAYRRELYEVTSGARSLRAYKRSPAYRVQLRRAILGAESAELRATSDIEKKRLKLKSEIARLELDDLESGGEPRALSGLIALRINFD